MNGDRIIRVTLGALPGGGWESVRTMPDPELSVHVRIYQGYFEASSQPVRRRELPSDEVALIISLGPRYELIDPVSGGSVGTRRTFIAGLDDTYALVDSGGTGVAVQIDFTPIGAQRVLQIPMHLISYRTTELSDLLGSQADRLVERLFEAPDWRSRFAILDEYLLSKIRHSPDVSREINWAWGQLKASHGALPMSRITDNLGWSRKRLVRAFRDQIGVPPKTLSRVLRFRHALVELGSRNMVSTALVAAECGYSDQAHMIREFRALSGSTPVELIRSYSPDGGIVEA
jgi:AraC-like DNA-binding protein